MKMPLKHLDEVTAGAGQRISAHDIVTLNQGHPTVSFPEPKETALTPSGQPRVYMSGTKFKKDTYLQLCAKPETVPADYEDGQLIRDSGAAVTPRVDVRRTDVGTHRTWGTLTRPVNRTTAAPQVLVVGHVPNVHRTRRQLRALPAPQATRP